jgi:D-alanine-D-alanine ligase
MYPRLWEASGISYPELVDRLIGLAVERNELKRGRGGIPPPEPDGS